MNLGTIICTLSWCKILPRNGYNCKTKTSQETEKHLRKFLEPSQKQKSFTQIHHLNLANPVKNYHGIIELQRLIGAMVEYYPISARDQARLHQFGKKVLPGIFLGYALIAGGIWERDILIADIEELENLDPSGNFPRRLNVLITHRSGEFVVPVPDGSKKNVRKRLRTPRTHLETEANRKTTWDIEVRRDFWSIQGDVIYRHHIEPRVQLYVQKEETFHVPLKYIDVTR